MAKINEYVYCLKSEARTASVTSQDFSNDSGRGLHCTVDVTSVTPSGSIVVDIQGKDRISGQYYNLLSSASYDTTGARILKIYPGLAASTNLVANDILPETWRINVTHTNNVTAGTVTYSVGASLIE